MSEAQLQKIGRKVGRSIFKSGKTLPATATIEEDIKQTILPTGLPMSLVTQFISEAKEFLTMLHDHQKDGIDTKMSRQNLQRDGRIREAIKVQKMLYSLEQRRHL